MNLEEALNLIPGYIDQELSLSETVDFERHLASSEECQREYNEQLRVSRLVKNNAGYFEATPQLMNRIEADFSLASERITTQKNTESIWNFNWVSSLAGTWGSKGMVMASIATLIFSTSLFLAMPTAQERLVEELTASHIRSLQANHLSDVISTDRHTVKPWFDGKLDYAPPVIDLASTGFRMEGGRLDYINGKTVAVIIYYHNKHPINLFIDQSSNKDSDIQRTVHHGYNLVHWTSNQMSYWAVSDLEANKLIGFAHDFQLKSEPHSK